MTKEQAKQMAEVLNAYAEGKTIEVLLDDEWGEVDLNEYSFNENESYRIKKTPTYRPFKNAEECFEEMKKHQPVGWIIFVSDDEYGLITSVEELGIDGPKLDMPYFIAKDSITFADGEPFGIKE